MRSLELKKDIYYVGSLDPNLRIFDIIMKTDYGTSYNSYLIKGEKTALIETVHEKFSEDFIFKISEFINIAELDYIVFNHTEPDHSGSLEKILDINPNINIVGSVSAVKNLRAITNRDFNAIIAKDGDMIDLGNNLILTFIIAPNLHWPDSMFTYIEGREILFTCDFLGCHYCEPMVIDKGIVYKDKYDDAFKYYYNGIFGSFKKYVLSGLAKIEGLTFDMVCTSHGPVLTDLIEKSIENYKNWSMPTVSKINSAAVIYVSAYGYTESIAKTLCTTLVSEGINATCYNAIEYELPFLREVIESSDALLIGSPTINRDAVKAIWDVLSVVDPIINKGKPACVFGSYGWSGEAQQMLADRVKSLKLNLIGEPIKCNFKPTNENINTIKDFAKDFAKECCK